MLEGEWAAGTMNADLIHIAVPELERLRGQEFLTATPAEGTDALAAEFVGPDDQWLISSLHLYAPMYNTDAVTADAVPQTWDDLLGFAGPIALSNPVSPGGQAQIFSSALEAGVIDEAWLQLADASPRVYPSIANASQAIITDEAELSLVGGYGTFMRLAKASDSGASMKTTSAPMSTRQHGGLRRLAHLHPRGLRCARLRDRHLPGRARARHPDAAG